MDNFFSLRRLQETSEMAHSENGEDSKKKRSKEDLSPKKNQKITRKEATTVIQRGKSFAEVVAAVGIKDANNEITSERLPPNWQPDHTQCDPVRPSIQPKEIQNVRKIDDTDEKKSLNTRSRPWKKAECGSRFFNNIFSSNVSRKRQTGN